MWCKNCGVLIDEKESCHACRSHKENGPEQLEIIEEGIVVEKGTRHGRGIAHFLGAILSFGGQAEATSPNMYWAKVKLPSLDEPLLIKSVYNFQKGAKVRVKYSKYKPESGPQLVIDWE